MVFIPARLTILGLLETSGGFPGIDPTSLVDATVREVGSPGELISQGTWICGKKPMGSGEVASSGQPVLLSRPDLPSISSPAPGVFSQLPAGQERTQPARNFVENNNIMTAVETVNITEPKERGGFPGGNGERGD